MPTRISPTPALAPALNAAAKREVLENILKTLDAKFYKPDLLGSKWQAAVAERRDAIEASSTPDSFEGAVAELLRTLLASHLGFFHETAQRASSRAALSATYMQDETPCGCRWIFQDVHAGGGAALAGLEPGDILLRVNQSEVSPPAHPTFAMGSASSMDVFGRQNEEQSLSVTVASPKGKKLQFVEPTLVTSQHLRDGMGYLKVAMFPGMMGVDVANQMSAAINGLGDIRTLIVDLRGNTGGGAGALRLMSLLTPDRIPVGFALNRNWEGRDIDQEKLRFPRLNVIPASKHSLWLLGLRFLPSLLRKSPVVLETEALGPKPYHSRVVLLVNRHTASAAEMVTMFAKENGLATIVGERTAGRLLSATSVKVGHSYRLALPTGAYHTWGGAVLEGNPIEPDVLVPFDWQERRRGVDGQLEQAVRLLTG